ncbi:MAG TPA: HEAT repeat domain-containing protein [Candidatus Bathyarchaeia archaeon]|nr:HEAT repeat domain-containing protein [Candidatus Bathyarchaeia archaeon]
MRGMSKAELELIDELYTTGSYLDLLRKTEKRMVEIFHALSSSRSMITLTFLLPFAQDRSQPLLQAARQAIQQIIERQGSKGLIGLDQYMRRLTPYDSMERLSSWHQLTPEEVSAISIQDQSDVSYLGVCSFHRNGYIREKAVERLAQVQSGREIAFLLIRLNDWLPKIRFLAFRALKQRLQPHYAKHFLESIYLVKHLSTYYTREKFSDFVEEIYARFRHPQSRNVLIDGLYAKDPVVRRFCFDFAITLPDMDHESMLMEVIKQPDAWLRLAACKHICSSFSGQALLRWLDRMKQDVFPPIRQLVLQTVVDRFPDQAQESLKQALLDRHKNIRELARYYLKKTEGMHYPSFYREKLTGTDAAVLLGAIAGMGETGDKTDAPLIMPFLSHESLRVNRASVKALAKLDPESSIDVFLQLLLSDKPSVSREARLALAELVDLRMAPTLLGWYTREQRLHVKKNILFLFSKLGKADSILYLLRASMVPEQEMNALAQRYVEAWVAGYNKRFYIQIRPERREELSVLLEEAKAYLPEKTVQELRFLL